MSRISHRPLTFSENDRFNETNWVIFKNLVTMTTKMRRAIECLDSSIKKPTTSTKPAKPAKPANLDKPTTKPKTTIVMITSEPTPWKCDEPTVRKWKAQNAWIKRLIMYNIHNMIGLGADILGTAEKL